MKYSIAYALILAATLWGCNTTQSPRQQIEDARITTEIKSKVAQNGMPSSLVNVKVDTTNGVVTLAGQVESSQVKERIGRTAEGIRGVVAVNNNLQIEPRPVTGIR